MINHILVPLDESILAECVLPHVLTLAMGMQAKVTLLHVLEMPQTADKQVIDPLEWHLKKNESEEYLQQVASKLQQHNLAVEASIMEGIPARLIVDYATQNDVDLIALSSHGRSGLSGWNISSVVQKIVLRSFKSILLVRAYMAGDKPLEEIRYRRLFVGLDFSTRAEYILPVAVSLAQFNDAELSIGMVIRKPEILHRFPLSTEQNNLIQEIADGNYRAASHYFDQLQSRLSLQGVKVHTHLVVKDNLVTALHDMVELENPDLVMLVAHGQAGENRWPYGSIASSFIAHGTSSLLMLQDLSGDEIKRTEAEIAAREIKGH
ncbi:MAG TPA: universal stress protein [Anaerolineales bacterium]|nr:universal stress protein [Anaerolineales bacterium]